MTPGGRPDPSSGDAAQDNRDGRGGQRGRDGRGGQRGRDGRGGQRGRDGRGGQRGRDGRAGPLRAVLAAFDAGAGDLGEVAERTGLDRGVVTAAVEHLIRSGRLQAERLSVGCPATGCSGCGSYAAPDPTSGPEIPGMTPFRPATTLGSGGCGGGTAPVEGRGPVVITITPRREH